VHLFHKDKHFKLPKHFAKSVNKDHKKKAVYNPFMNMCERKAQEELLAGLLG